MSNKIGDYPTAKKGIDDITCVAAFLKFKMEPEINLVDPFYGRDNMM